MDCVKSWSSLAVKKIKRKSSRGVSRRNVQVTVRQNLARTSPSENTREDSPSENTPGANTSEDSPSENSRHASIQELEKKLATIKTIEELKGFANRRSIFKLDVPKWSENEKRAIQWRKIEIERGRR